MADQAQIIGLALVLILMMTTAVTQDQQGGPGDPTGAGQVEGQPLTYLTNAALHVASAGYIFYNMRLL